MRVYSANRSPYHFCGWVKTRDPVVKSDVLALLSFPKSYIHPLYFFFTPSHSDSVNGHIRRADKYTYRARHTVIDRDPSKSGWGSSLAQKRYIEKKKKKKRGWSIIWQQGRMLERIRCATQRDLLLTFDLSSSLLCSDIRYTCLFAFGI